MVLCQESSKSKGTQEKNQSVLLTSTISATIKSTDAAIKGADVEIVEIRLADHLGGKAFAIVTGQVEDVQAAVNIAHDNTTQPKYWVRQTVIPHLHIDMATQIDKSTYFGQLDVIQLQEGEI